MLTDEAGARLLELLAQAGVDLDHPAIDAVERVLAAIRRFAAETVDDISSSDDSDGILAQYGTYDWGEGDAFELDLTRQFAFDDDDGEYSHMSQLSCTLLYPATAELRELGSGNLWSFGLTHDEFFRQALALSGFSKLASDPRQPVRIVLEYSEI